ncbi:P-loop containing nucleoside triphosphate hydrolase protein [Xylaria intraflava]|nr:P-loop containing nucleoside triphosphate hydrolase protein [Xylaria intraflava]
MAIISLDPEAMEQLNGERKALFDAIRSLRKYGVSPSVGTPKIVVVGVQSSGKSSVLEAILGVRFPIKEEPRTRFATEFALRTDPQTELRVRLLPIRGATNPPYPFSETSPNIDDVSRIVEEATTHLLQDNPDFSHGVLRIEISSPDVPDLTLIDAAGIWQLGGTNPSTDTHRIVRHLIEDYITDKNSVILAVVPANGHTAGKLLSKIRSHVNNHDRILGVITKPDLLTQGSQDEGNVVKLARNQDQSHHLTLGWHILRNRSDYEGSLSPEERDDKEREFFGSGIWLAIPAGNRGAGALRKRLAGILLDHTREKLGKIIKEINDNLNSRQKRLGELGEPRSSPRQVRAHLDKIASRFQLLSLRAIEGNYSDEFFGGLYPDRSVTLLDDDRIRKLRALVRDLNRTFAYVLFTEGSRRIIRSESPPDVGSHNIELPPILQILRRQYPFSHTEKVTRETIRAELKVLSSANQGSEFPGSTNDLLAIQLFRDQARPWEAIARFHIDLVLRIAKSFTEKLLAYITGPDSKTCSAILLNVVNPFFEKRTKDLEDKLQELLYNFRSGYAQPLDGEFRTIMESRQKHWSAGSLQTFSSFADEGKQELAAQSSSSRKSEFDVDKLINKSETYYELSLRTFTDNVIILAVENCLIKDLPMILTTSRVSQMEDDELERLAAESADIRAEREVLQRESEGLKKGLDCCRTYGPRNSTVFSTVLVQFKDSSPAASGNSVETSKKQVTMTPQSSEVPSSDISISSSTLPSSLSTGSQTSTGNQTNTNSSIAGSSGGPVPPRDQATPKPNPFENYFHTTAKPSSAPKPGLFQTQAAPATGLFGSQTSTTPGQNPNLGAATFASAFPTGTPGSGTNRASGKGLFATPSSTTTSWTFGDGSGSRTEAVINPAANKKTK